MSQHTVDGAARAVNPSDPLTEEWRAVVGFPQYEVSNLGGVRRFLRSPINRGKFRYRKWCFNTAGYPQVGLARDGKCLTRPVHALVAEAFIGPRPEGMQINHKNGNKLDPRPENLEYVSPAYNTQHAYDNGLIHHPRGEDWHNTKVTETDVRRMRKLAELGVRQVHLAVAFELSEPRVSEIINRKAWQHVA